MTMQSRLPGTSTRARKGRTENAVETTFKAWSEQGRFVGNEHAAVRQTLRLMAKTADELYVEGKHQQANQAAAALFDRLDQLQPEAKGSELQDFLAQLEAQANATGSPAP